ncbi:MAG: hypothetical protein ACJ8CR_17260 [Roseiflexaceae bacterium]
MKQTYWWILGLSVAALMLAAACLVEQSASQGRQANMWQLAPTSFDGFYGAEESTTLPGVPVGERRIYRWTRPASQFSLWPHTATSSALDLEYLDPLGATTLQVAQEAPFALTPAQHMRRLHMLFPPASDLTIRLVQTMPQTVDGRQLGLIVGDVRWSALGWRARAGDVRAYGWLLLGLPLTLALLGGLGWVVRLPARRTIALLALVLAGVAIFALRSPWDARAMQPALQRLIGGAMIGAGLLYLKRHAWFSHWALIIAGVWCLSLLLFFSPEVTSDGVGYYAYLRSAVIDGDLNFTNEFDPQQSPFTHTPLIIPAARPGYVVNSWSVGPALYWAPFWLVGHAVADVGRQLGFGWRADGYDPPYIVLIALASALTGLVTMLGCFKILARWFTPGVAAVAAITIYLGSNLLYYAQLAGSFAHSLSAATATWLLLAALRLDEQPTMRRWLALGLAAGALLLTYWMAALLLIIPLGVGLRHAWLRARQRDVPGLLRLAAGALAAGGLAALLFAPQLLAWKLTLGSWLAVPQGSAYATPQQSHLSEVLFGSLYGIAWWTPAYFAGLVGGIWFALRRPWPGLALLAAAGVYLLYNASLPDWHGSGGFGMRRLTSIAPLFAVGLALLLDRARRYRPLPAMLAGALIVWSIGMTVRYAVFQLPHAPYTLQDLGLRPILLSPEPFPVGALLFVTQHSWFGALLRTLDAGSLLILSVCLLAVAACTLLWRRYTWRAAHALGD